MSKKSKKNRNGNHTNSTPQPVRIRPEQQVHAEANPEPARGWFPRIRAYVAECLAAFKRGYQEGRRQAGAAYEAARVEAVRARSKIVAASVMVTSALFWAKVRARMAAPVVEVGPVVEGTPAVEPGPAC